MYGRVVVVRLGQGWVAGGFWVGGVGGWVGGGGGEWAGCTAEQPQSGWGQGWMVGVFLTGVGGGWGSQTRTLLKTEP